jgi:hypothetical protein
MNLGSANEKVGMDIAIKLEAISISGTLYESIPTLV